MSEAELRVRKFMDFWTGNAHNFCDFEGMDHPGHDILVAEFETEDAILYASDVAALLSALESWRDLADTADRDE